MVLVSHIYKFIYLKNYKVAGTSVESFFGQFCIDPEKRSLYSFKHEQSEVISKWGILGVRENGISYSKRWFGHKSAKDTRTDLGNKIFNEYFKFCVVRNPYDSMVSAYYFHKSRCDFKTYCKNYKKSYDMDNLLKICIDGTPICNYYIHYENLIDDILVVLDKLGIKDFDIKDLPNHKAGYNPHKKPYQDYYDDETKEIVRRLFQKELEFFGYKF